jgi:superfamily I DNA/RNA helicase
MPLPDPVGRQVEVLALPAKGHYVVLGTAGSGKTTLAILRSAYLADRDLPGNGPTLLVTFNNALLAYLRHLGHEVLGNVTVETYHKFGRGYLYSLGLMSFNSIIGAGPREALLETARLSILEKYPQVPILRRPKSFFSREIQWITQHGINSSQTYVDTERIGRSGVRVARNARPYVYAVLEEYKALRESKGYKYDWDDLPSKVLEKLREDTRPLMYKHIVIDEGQDFSPEMLRSLAAAIPPDGSLTFFGDSAQQIYGSSVSWKSSGLSVSNIWQFKENYRNTREIARLAIAISNMPYYQGVADLVEPTLPAAAGPSPSLVRFQSRAEELRFITDMVHNKPVSQSLAILLTDRSIEGRLGADLRRNATRLDRELGEAGVFAGGPGVYYGTFHSAKGLEFDSVVIPFMDELSSDPTDIEAIGEEDALTQAGKLLYVGVTRCRVNLVLTQVGDEINSLLPAPDDLYAVFDR